MTQKTKQQLILGAALLSFWLVWFPLQSQIAEPSFQDSIETDLITDEDSTTTEHLDHHDHPDQPGLANHPAMHVQKAAFSDLSAKTDIFYEGVQGMKLFFDVGFDYSPFDLYPDSLHRNLRYKARLELLDTEGKIITAVPDASGYTVVNLAIKIQQYIVLSKSQKNRSDAQFFIPYFALNLPEGQHEIALNLSLRDEQSREWIIENKVLWVVINKPKSTLVKLKVKQFEVGTADPDGEIWDFSMLSIKDELPDLKWKLTRAGMQVHNSSKQFNTLFYKGRPADETDYITLSKGDKVFFSVKDFDVMSASDPAAEFFYDPNEGVAGITDDTLQEGVVSNFILSREVIDAPGVKIGGLKVTENQVYEGETGVVLSFNYQKFGPIEQTSRLRIFLNQDENKLAKNARMIVGGLEREEPGIFLFGEDDLGNISIFIPGYELLAAGQGKPVEADIRVWTRFRNMIYNSSNLAAKIHPLEMAYTDLSLQNLEITEATQYDAKGVQFSFDWNFPTGWGTILPGATYPLKFKLFAGGQRIVPFQRNIIQTGDLALYGDVAYLSFGKTSGTTVIFVPWYLLGLGEGSHIFSLSLEGKISSPAFTFDLGSASKTDTLVAPPLSGYGFKITELTVKKPKPEADYRWRVSLGGKLIYSAYKGRGSGNVRWPVPENVSVIASPGDQLKIEVFQIGTTKETILANWLFPVEKLEVLRRKKIKLKSNRIRPLFIYPM